MQEQTILISKNKRYDKSLLRQFIYHRARGRSYREICKLTKKTSSTLHRYIQLIRKLPKDDFEINLVNSPSEFYKKAGEKNGSMD